MDATESMDLKFYFFVIQMKNDGLTKSLYCIQSL